MTGDIDKETEALEAMVKERDRLVLKVEDTAKALSLVLAQKAETEGGIQVYSYFNYWIKNVADKLPIKEWVSHLALSEAINSDWAFARHETVHFCYLGTVDCNSMRSDDEIERDAIRRWTKGVQELANPDALKRAIIELMSEGIGGFVNDW